MKLLVLCLALSVFHVSGSVYSQKTTFTFNNKNVTVGEVLQEIENNSDYKFLYRTDLIDINRKVNLHADNSNVEELLDLIFPHQSASFRFFEDNLIAITRNTLPDQQQITVRGRVTDASTGVSLPGASIVVQGTTIGTTSNIEGEYSLVVPEPEAVLVFSYVGYLARNIIVGEQRTIDVSLDPDYARLDEVIVVGYGTQRRSDLTGSVERISSQDFDKRAITNIVEAFAGTVPGFYSVQGTLAEGGGSMEIRGPSSLAADISPLIVLDGVIYTGSIRDINPNDIESVDILKDASSAAIFGSRAASGVVVITTTKGQRAEPVINISSKFGIIGLTNHMKPFGPEGYMNLKSDFFNTVRGHDMPPHYYTNPDRLPDDITVQQWLNYDAAPADNPVDAWLIRLALSPMEMKNYHEGITKNWYDDITQTGIRQDYDASVSGGMENIRYYFSAGYTANEGVTLGDEYKIFRSRVNVDTDLSDFLKVGVNAQFSDRDQGFNRIDILSAVRMSPYTREYDDEGKMVMYPNDWILNPYLVHTYRQRLDKTQTVFANLFAEMKLPLGFSYRVNFSNNFLWRRNYLFDPIETPRGLSNNGYGERAHQHNYNWMVDNLLYWNQTIADIHRLDFTFLANVEKNQSTYEQQIAFNMEPTDVLGYHALQAGINSQLLNDDLVSTGNALMARVNYSLMDRYMFTASIRRDGYSAFGEGRPYAYFPSLALAWVISEEDFYNIDLVNNLKIRGSWGSAGNRDIHPYAALAKLSTIRYLYGTTPASGVYSSSMANHDLRWENTESVNLGIDFALLNSRLNGSIEVYRQLTTDLLLDRSLPQISGYQSVMANLGELENKGIEMSFNSVNIVNPNINWRSNLIFSFNRNKIKRLYGDMIDVKDEQGNVVGQKEADDVTNQWFIGESLDRVWEYEYLGIWQVHEADQAAIYGKRPGDVKLRDVNESGYYTPLDDKMFLGYSKPQYRIGFRNDITFLRNFEFSAFIRADLGFIGINNAYNNHGIGGGQFDRQNIYEFDYWTPDNPSAKYPRLSTDISSPEYYVWKDRSFVRLQNVSLAYNIPSEYIQRFDIKSLRVFIDMNNALTFTSWDHYDPESGMTPMPKFVTFGLNLGL